MEEQCRSSAEEGRTASLTPSTAPSLGTAVSEAAGREHFEEGFCSHDFEEADETDAAPGCKRARLGRTAPPPLDASAGAPACGASEAHPFLRTHAILGRFCVCEKVGEGTFSVVYRAVPKDDALRSVYPSVVLKILTRTCEAQGRILREVQFLNKLQGDSCVPFVSQLVGAVREDAQLVLVLSYHPCDRFSSSLIRTMSIMDVKLYMISLFSCIAFVHSKGIVHRDIKPSNFLYSMELKQGILIDFGLAQLEKDASQPVSSHRTTAAEEHQGSESSRQKKNYLILVPNELELEVFAHLRF